MISSGVVDSQDGFQYLAVARNIYYKGKPTSPHYEFNTRQNVHMPVVLGKDGESYGFTGLGFSLALVPAVALTDLVYKIYNVTPPVHFPLENDWLILLTASFTNAFFGTILGVILFKYFLVLNLRIKQAFFLSIVSIFATNLLVYTKHINAHMMFITFLTLTFLLIKLYSLNRKRVYLIFSGISYGILSIIYNPTFILSFLPLVLYYLLLTKPKFKNNNIRSVVKDSFYVLIGFIPFALIFIWFENLRAFVNTNINYASPSFYNAYADHLTKFPVTILIEGLYGQLFSPGRSIFIYSPLLLIIIFFWFKIKKSLHPETFAFLLLSVIYILFYTMQYSVGSTDQGLAALWHGENSWGPRYLTPLIPLGMLIVGNIYITLSKKIKYIIFYPLALVGIYISLLGVLIPYQTKYHNLEKKFFLNGTEYTVFSYSNLLPRYTPILNISKNLIKLGQNFPKTFDHGVFNVKFYDGIDFPFNVGPERWRAIEGDGYISFDNNSKNPVSEISLGLINHPIGESSSSASLHLYLNDIPLLAEPSRMAVTERNLLMVPIKKELVFDKDNKLVVQVRYDEPKVLETKGQILGLQFFEINKNRINMESIDVPYVSALGPKIAGVTYQNWGGTNEQVLGFANKDPWKYYTYPSF